jgi:hypothetical protein
MGERIIRPGIRTSDRTAKLVRDGGWMAQVFYDWMLTVVDDYGRYDARPAILRVEVFPLLLDKVREADVSRCLTECEKAGLVRLYAVGGKPYLELLDFRQRLRAKTSRWPAPPPAGSCHDIVVTMPTDTETDTETDTTPQAADSVEWVTGKGVEIPEPLRTTQFLDAWRSWEKYHRERHTKGTAEADKRQLAKCVAWGPAAAAANIENSITHNWQGIFPQKDGRNGNGHAVHAEPVNTPKTYRDL